MMVLTTPYLQATDFLPANYQMYKNSLSELTF